MYNVLVQEPHYMEIINGIQDNWMGLKVELLKLKSKTVTQLLRQHNTKHVC